MSDWRFELEDVGPEAEETLDAERPSRETVVFLLLGMAFGLWLLLELVA